MVARWGAWLRFRDGSQGEVDLHPLIHGGVFEPLRDPAYFANFSLNRDFDTICWPNGADIAPETLHAMVRAPQGTP